MASVRCLLLLFLCLAAPGAPAGQGTAAPQPDAMPGPRLDIDTSFTHLRTWWRAETLVYELSFSNKSARDVKDTVRVVLSGFRPGAAGAWVRALYIGKQSNLTRFWPVSIDSSGRGRLLWVFEPRHEGDMLLHAGLSDPAAETPDSTFEPATLVRELRVTYRFEP